jgi:hypothetical protein
MLGCFDDTVWENRYLCNETKLRIYGSAMRPILKRADITEAK